MDGVISRDNFSTSEELMPCPFCGGFAEPIVLENYKGDKEYHIECADCSASMSSDEQATLVAHWNARAV